MATQEQESAALQRIDDATSAIASNLTTVSDTISTIGTEVDALVAAQQAAGVPQAILDQTTALGDKLSAASSALAAQVPVLQAIASKGSANPVPVPVPPVV